MPTRVGFPATDARHAPDVADDLEALERSVEKTRDWVDDTAVQLCTDDRSEAYVTLKAVLHAIRDAMSSFAGSQATQA